MNTQLTKPKRAKSRLGCVECKAKRVGEHRCKSQLSHTSLTFHSGNVMRLSHPANNANDGISLVLATNRPFAGRRSTNIRMLLLSEVRLPLYRVAASHRDDPVDRPEAPLHAAPATRAY